MSQDGSAFATDSTLRRLARRLVRIAAIGSAGLIIAGMLGQAIRDRSIAAALLTYVPLILVGAAAAVLDLAQRGRSLPRLRFGLALLGLAAIADSAYAMTGSGVADEPRPGDRAFSVLHWNVQWGGGLLRGPKSWAAQRAAIVEKDPDLVVLSEAPPGDWLDRLVEDLGPGASRVRIRHDSRSPYWFGLVVCSRWPLEFEGRVPLSGGVGMSVTAVADGRRLRLLVVDGLSSPLRPRGPFLHSIATACREAATSGRPYDLILGDFNTPSRSLGFDGLEDIGFRLAGRSAPGWRGTFPAWVPVYDIDHVWAGPRIRLGSCSFFHGPYTDHRGQVVGVLLAEDHAQ